MKRHSLNETGIFFVKVHIDSELVCDQAATIRGASLEYLYFIR